MFIFYTCSSFKHFDADENFYKMIYLSLKIVFILANKADLDEMPPYVAFHLSLHCLSKYLFTGIENGKGFKNYLQLKFSRK